MLIRSISLNNIRSYKDAKIEFPVGSVMLAGDIGAGKSSILLAIEFALFGIRRGLFSGASLLRHDAREGYVEMKFSISGKEVIVKRVLKRTKDAVSQSAGFIVFEGRKLDLSPQELNAKVLEILGYPEELLTKSKDLLFRYTVYTPQEQMKQILTEEPEARLGTLRKLFGIEKYKTIRENAVIYTRELKQRKKMLEGIIRDLPEKEFQKKELEEKSSGFSKEINRIKPMLEMKRSDLAGAEQTFKSLDDQQKDILRKGQQAAALDAKLKELKSLLEITLKKQHKSATEIRMIKEELELDVDAEAEQSVEKQLKELQDEVNSISNGKRLIVQNIAFLKTKADELLKEIEEKSARTAGIADREKMIAELSANVKDKHQTEKNKSETEAIITSLLGELRSLSTRLKEADAVKKNISALEECPYCLQNVDDEHKSHIVTHKNNEIVEINEELNKRESVLKKEQEQLEKTNVALKKISEYEIKMKSLKFEVSSLMLLKDEVLKKTEIRNRSIVKLGELEKEKILLESKDIFALQDKCKSLEMMLKNIQRKKQLLALMQEKENQHAIHTQDIIRLEHDVKNVEISRKDIEHEIGKAQEIDLAHKAALDLLYKLRDEERALSISLMQIEKERAVTGNFINTLNIEIENKRRSEKQLGQNMAIQNWIEDKFIPLMHTIENAVMARVHSEFNSLFQEWFSMLIEDDALQARLDSDFSPLMMQNGFDTEVENLSGGEKTSVALAYRLALNKVINDVVNTINTKDLIILDEPTDGFSSEQLDKVREVLEQLNVKQVIIVSHESKIESFVDNVIRIGKRSHNSEII